MTEKKSAEASPASLARAERQRLASEEGARAMADVEKQSNAVRENMERLRVLRQAKEAEEARIEASLPAATKKKPKKAARKVE